eukprot:5014630-Pyramimonas_sp.AAC.1
MPPIPTIPLSSSYCPRTGGVSETRFPPAHIQRPHASFRSMPRHPYRLPSKLLTKSSIPCNPPLLCSVGALHPLYTHAALAS